MEIELDNMRSSSIWIAGIILALVVFGVLGHAYTSVDEAGYPLVLSWSEWRLFQIKRAYLSELGRLQKEADSLATMLNKKPDPVRAQINAERVSEQYATGLAALERQRKALVTAAITVQDWSAGFIAYEDAQFAVMQLVEMLMDRRDSARPEPNRVFVAANTEGLYYLPMVGSDGQHPANPYPAPGVSLEFNP